MAMSIGLEERWQRHANPRIDAAVRKRIIVLR